MLWTLNQPLSAALTLRMGRGYASTTPAAAVGGWPAPGFIAPAADGQTLNP
ncbi:hypothetical protein NXS98_05470 [Fontisphaera persica]|uniref:hypothetical protein n=1 Tax=Fontisphaera persica TaxID=2974023 RepID=UPI0024C050B8|nr:hypothetical protein [Fontisphaera persica]WCJ60579.1 hypothetical protein NXS98_05470 [Fontisphaera persica]